MKGSDDWLAPHPPTIMTEDCLRLDIHTPVPESIGNEETWPVLVWLHGGEYKVDSASALTAPAVFPFVVKHRIVVVAVDFREGIFGYLGSRSLWRNTTGDWGTLDQKLALNWVSKHIKHFGGDPTRITLGGWSSGAAAVSIHLTMQDQSIIQHAIMMSGGFASWAAFDLGTAEESYQEVLQMSGCQWSVDCQEPGPPCACLLNLTAAELLDIEKLNRGISWAPIVDGTTVPMPPKKALLSQDAMQLPIVIGSAVEDSLTHMRRQATNDEFLGFLQTQVPTEYLMQAYHMYMEDVNSSTVSDPFHAGFSPAYWAARRVMA